MTWPSDADYREAIQTPKVVFGDVDLRQGVPEEDKMGLPKPRSGAAATVYKIHCGPRSWAVRCFRYELQDQQQRYAAITKYLQQLNLTYTVGFTFLSQGIRIRGKWFPILKMEWVEGESLLTFVKNNVGKPQALLTLAAKWIAMVHALEASSIAHGDLQHGNVLVQRGELKLVDYDGMFVPPLDGYSSLEIGHKHYQHPLRTSSDFGSYLDNFSSWAIYLSLVLLSADASLWAKFNGGDDCLLFRKQDFEKPDVSFVFRTLENHRDPRVQSATLLFKSLLSLPPRQLPRLNGDLISSIDQITSKPTTSATDWLSDYVKRKPQPTDARPTQKTDRVEEQLGDPSWIADFLTPARTPDHSTFQGEVSRERIIAICSIVASLLLFATGSSLASTPFLVVTTVCVLLNIVIWRYGYANEPCLAIRRKIQQQMSENASQIEQVDRTIKNFQEEKRLIQAQFKAEQEKLSQERAAVQKHEQQALQAVTDKYQRQMAAISTQKKNVNQIEATALQKIASEIDPLLKPLDRELNQLDYTEADEIATLLQRRQQDFVKAYLKGFTVDSASIPGVGPAFRNRLQRAGYHTAADIDYGIMSVHGIGPTRAAAIRSWRTTVEAMAQSKMPRALPASELNPVKAKYSQRRAFLQQEIEKLRTRRRTQETAIVSQANTERDRLAREEAPLQRAQKSEADTVRSQYRQSYDAIDQAEAKIPKNRDDKTKAVEQRVQGQQRTLFKLRYQEGRLRISKAPYNNLTFPRYVARIFGA